MKISEYKIVFLILAFPVLNFSCINVNKHSNIEKGLPELSINITVDTIKKYKIDTLSKILSDYLIVPLETTTESALGPIKKLVCKDSLIYILDNNGIKNGIKIKSYHSPVVADKLKGKSFVVTGSLETMTRDEAHKTIIQYGGEVVSSVSAKTASMQVSFTTVP